MKVQGDLKPTALYTVERNPKRPGLSFVRFYENAVEIENGWEYDEYHLEVEEGTDIESDFDNYLQAAKSLEPVDEVADLQSDVAQLVEADAALEDVLCDLDIEYDERITATEDAICELDMMLNGG